MVAEKFNITTIRHPQYYKNFQDYVKYRLVFEGGQLFKQHYLEQFSLREDAEEYKQRLKISYSPCFSKATIQEIINSISQRLPAVKRLEGPRSYQTAIQGLAGGVDNLGSSMNRFLGQKILTELLPMSKVGVYVDRPPLGSNLSLPNQRQYLYYYMIEDILSWNLTCMGDEYVYTNILLKDNIDTYNVQTGLTSGTAYVYRHMWVADGGVYVDIYNAEGDKTKQTTFLSGFDRVPFVLFSLTKSLLTDVADYQIALLNLESSDINYALKSNFPFYTEQYDERTNSAYLIQAKQLGLNNESVISSPTGTSKEIVVGQTRGRRYGTGTDRPGFIHPSSEPLKASMDKEVQLKEDIRTLVNLSLASTQSTHASAESKAMDDRTLEGGLASIGLELQHGENQIAKIWAMYENAPPAQIYYPKKYSLKSEAEKQAEIKQLSEVKSSIPSKTCSKEISKKIVVLLLENEVTSETIEKINKEIDEAKYLTSDYKEINLDVQNGIVDKTTASIARGYDGEAVIPIAEEEHVRRLAEIAAAQTVRGVNDPGNTQAKQDKNPPTSGPPPRRGDGK